MLRSSRVFVLAGGILALALPTAARAESAAAPPSCRGIAADYPTVPANAPALYASPYLIGTAPTFVLGLSPNPDDAIIFTQERDTFFGPVTTLFQPSQPFQSGTSYELTATLSCDGFPVDSPETKTTFLATEPSELPTTIGTVQVTFDETRGASHIDLTPSAELAAYQWLAAVGWRSGPSLSEVGRYGDWARGGSRRVVEYRPDSFNALCTGQSAGRREAPVTITAHVAGALTDPPSLTVQVPFECSNILDAGPPGTPDGSPRLTDAGADDAVDATASSTDGGCAATAKAASGTSALGLVSLALAALGRRRRARR